jgi:hypothetical protein
MQNRTTGIVVTVIAVLLCGCPGLVMACVGPLLAVVSFVPGAEIDIFGSSEPQSALTAGIGFLLMGLVLIVITALVGFFSLRRKPGQNKPANAVVDVVAEAPVSPVTPEAPVAPEAAETRRITGEDRLPPTS